MSEYRTEPYLVEDDAGNEITCDAVIVNEQGNWAAIWDDEGAQHVTFDGTEYIPFPDEMDD